VNDASTLPTTLVLLGAGKMGSAMLRGWLALGMDGHGVTIVDPYPADDLMELAKEHGILVNPPSGTISPPEALVLAIKPQTLEAAALDIAPLVGANTLVLSIMAGKTIANINQRLPKAKAIVRAMPNTPAAVGRGITGAATSAGVSAAQRAAPLCCRRSARSNGSTRKTGSMRSPPSPAPGRPMSSISPNAWPRRAKPPACRPISPCGLPVPPSKALAN